MQLTVLGRWGAWPPPGGACSGYLVEAGDTRLLLDCGTGVLERLQRVTDPRGLTGVLITHLHPDHILDLYPLRLCLQFARADAPPPMPLLAPADTREVLGALLDGDSAEGFFRVFEHRPLAPAMRLGDLTMRVAPVRHAIPAWAVRFEAGGASLVFSADTTASDALVELARGADVLLCESTLLDRDLEVAARVGHLTARMAGEVAASAGVRRLLLTHFFPTNRPEESLAEAQKAFTGPIEIVEEGRAYQVAPP